VARADVAFGFFQVSQRFARRQTRLALRAAPDSLRRGSR